MGDERSEVTGRELARWLAVALLILAGIGLYFRFARTAEPVITPAGAEAVP